MLATKGVPRESYVKDVGGRRYGLSPFLHYPDLCTIYTNNEVGECWRECHDLLEDKRPCWMKAHGIELPQPEPETPEEVKQEKPRQEKTKTKAPVDQVEKLRQELEAFARGDKTKVAEVVVSDSPDGFDLGVALDTLIAQAEGIQVGDKQAAKELRRLVKSMSLLRERVTEVL